MSVARILALAAAVAVAACGARPRASLPAPAPKPTTPTAAQAFRAAQVRACGRMCSVITRCALAQLRARINADALSPAQRRIAGEVGDAELQRNTRECSMGCQDSEISQRQLQVVQGCAVALSGATEPTLAQCDDYLDCLDAAQKQPR